MSRPLIGMRGENKVMKTKRNILVKLTFGAAFLAAALVVPGLQAAEVKKAAAVEDSARLAALSVNFDDFKGDAYGFEVGDAREELLRQALDKQVNREKWLKSYSFSYNEDVGESPRNHLELRVIDWDRSRTNMVEFAVRARYFDHDGKSLDLGTFYGYRSGLIYAGRIDGGLIYVDAAQDAIKQAFDKLEKLVS